jgi:hypothetical protein
MVEPRLSRPLRWAAQLTADAEAELVNYFRKIRIAVRLEPALESNPDARETVLAAVNMLLRFCPGVTVAVGGGAGNLKGACKDLAKAILGNPDWVEIMSPTAGFGSFNRVLNVGMSTVADAPCTVINSTGWVARVSPDGSPLKWIGGPPNAIGAIGAACIGVGVISMSLLRNPVPPRPIEMSLFSHAIGSPGELDPGPTLPDRMRLDALLIGCGGVANGWAYTVKRLPIVGRLEAVDRQSLKKENIGPYVLATIESLGQPKANVIRDALAPQISVTPRPEAVEFYKIRLDQNLVELPGIVIAGLDDIPPRHFVQHLWPDVLIDLAAGGTTTQLIVHELGKDGICLLEALQAPSDQPDYADQAASETGLSAERIRTNPTDPITEADVAAAPPEFQSALDAARKRGQLLCGRVTEHHLHEEGYSDDFAPAVPFVSAFSGVAGAAATVKAVMGWSEPLHYQFDFRSLKGRVLKLVADQDCECRRVGRQARSRSVN